MADLRDLADTYDKIGNGDIRVIMKLPGGTKCVACKKKFTDNDDVKSDAMVVRGVPIVSHSHEHCPES